MKILESIDNLLVEGRLKDVKFDDLFGPDGRRKSNHNRLDHWLGEYGEAFAWEIEHEGDLTLRDFAPDEVRSSMTFEYWADEDEFADKHGREDELPEEYDWGELYRLWVTSGWDGFEYDGKRWRSAVQDFADSHDLDAWELIETGTVKEWVRDWARGEFDRIVSMLERKAIGRDGLVHIWRVMTVRKDWIEHLAKDGKRLGIYWSWEKDSAHAYWKDTSKPRKAVVKSSINEEYVNWMETVALNMHPSLGFDEAEIRLFKNTPIKIERLHVDGKEVDLPPEIRNKIFKA